MKYYKLQPSYKTLLPLRTPEDEDFQNVMSTIRLNLNLTPRAEPNSMWIGDGGDIVTTLQLIFELHLIERETCAKLSGKASE
jgi:TolB-like protein